MRQSMKTLTQIWGTFLLANIISSTHFFNANFDKAQLLHYIMRQIVVDVAELILDELYKFVL